MTDTNKIPYALSAADKYLEMAGAPYKLLSERLSSRLAGSTDALVSNPGELSPLISNVSFGLELLLKVLRIQDSSIAPRGHELFKLFDPLDVAIKNSLEVRYQKHIRCVSNSGDAPYVLFNLSNISPNIDTSPSVTFQDALNNMNRAFEQWRYMYELEDTKLGFLYFNFFESIAVAKSLREEIAEFKGDAIVKFERT